MAMALSNSLVLSKPSSQLPLSSGFLLKSGDLSVCPSTFSLNPNRARNTSSLSVQARHSDGGNPGAFVGGFILGGLVVGTIGCVFAPQISTALAAAERIERKELMKKLPKFIYDEEKVLEKQRKKLADKIEEINNAIDGISSQMRHGDETAVNSNKTGSEAAI